MLIGRKEKIVSEALQRKENIVIAATAYTTGGLNLKNLSALFGVSENTIASWFCDGVSKRYIANDETCIDIMNKHIAEYEFYHDIENSSLRTMYKTAFDTRKTIAPVIANPVLTLATV